MSAGSGQAQSVNPVCHGSAHTQLDVLSIGNGVNGNIGGGTFTCGAAGLTVILDASLPNGGYVAVFPTNGPAGLLMRTKSCYVTGVANDGEVGSFNFIVSATGAGAPAGTETFMYLHFREPA